MKLYPLFVLIHVMSGAFAVMNLIFMQYVVSGLMQRLPEGPVRKMADTFLEERWRRKVSYVIVLLAVSAGIMLYENWVMIVSEPAYTVKAILGGLAITTVSINHFWYRHYRRRWAGNPEHAERFQRSKTISFWLEKTALAGAIGAACIAWYMRHGF